LLASADLIVVAEDVFRADRYLAKAVFDGGSVPDQLEWERLNEMTRSARERFITTARSSIRIDRGTQINLLDPTLDRATSLPTLVMTGP
jgi:hypothetical protein